MKFRNRKTGHILTATNEDCIEMMRSSPVYEEVKEEAASASPETKATNTAPRTKASRGKAPK